MRLQKKREAKDNNKGLTIEDLYKMGRQNVLLAHNFNRTVSPGPVLPFTIYLGGAVLPLVPVFALPLLALDALYFLYRKYSSFTICRVCLLGGKEVALVREVPFFGLWTDKHKFLRIEKLLQEKDSKHENYCVWYLLSRFGGLLKTPECMEVQHYPFGRREDHFQHFGNDPIATVQKKSEKKNKAKGKAQEEKKGASSQNDCPKEQRHINPLPSLLMDTDKERSGRARRRRVSNRRSYEEEADASMRRQLGFYYALNGDENEKKENENNNNNDQDDYHTSRVVEEVLPPPRDEISLMGTKYEEIPYQELLFENELLEQERRAELSVGEFSSHNRDGSWSSSAVTFDMDDSSLPCSSGWTDTDSTALDAGGGGGAMDMSYPDYSGY
jgi:hypothetical protein